MRLICFINRGRFRGEAQIVGLLPPAQRSVLSLLYRDWVIWNLNVQLLINAQKRALGLWWVGRRPRL